MADKKASKKVKNILKEKELDKVTGGCNPDYVTGKYDPDAPEPGSNPPAQWHPKTNCPA